MRLVTLVLLQTFLILHSAATGSFSVSNEGNKDAFASLDQAFSETAGLEEVELSLLPSVSPYSTSGPVVLCNHLRVLGEGQSLQLGNTLQVGESGFLTISNVSLSVSNAFTDTFAFDVRGSFLLEGSSMRDFRVVLMWLSGRANLTEVAIVGSMERTVVLGGNAVLGLDSVSTSQLRGCVACLDLSFIGVPYTVTVTNSYFEESQAAHFAANGRGGVIHVTSSTFVRNWLRMVETQGVGHIVTFDSCVFRDNSDTIVVASVVSEAEIRIRNCTFTNNHDVAVFIWEFAGVLVMEECTVTQERGSGVLYLSTDVTTTNSLVLLSNLYIADIKATPDLFQRTYLIAIFTGTIYISNLTIANVTLRADTSMNLFSCVFLFRVVNVWMSNVTVRDTTVDLCMFASYFSTVYVSDLSVDNFSFGAAVYFIGGSSFYIRNIDFRRVARVTLVIPQLFLLQPVYFGLFSGYLEARNVSISDSTGKMGPCFTMAFSNYSLSHIHLSHLLLEAVLASSMSNGDVSDIQIDTVTVDVHAFIASYSLFTLSNLTFTNSQMIDKAGVILFGKSSATISNFVMRNCSMEEFIHCRWCTIVVNNLDIEKCRVDWSLFNIVSSGVSMEGLEVRESVMRRVSMTDSNVTIGLSAFSSLYSADMLLDIASSHLSFLHLNFINITTVTELARISHGSTVTIQTCEFIGLQVKNELGWQVSASTLRVSDSHFSHFYYGLFQAVASNLTLLSSTFEEGRNPIQSLRSSAAFGGVLSCVDCPWVSISESTFLNVSSLIGGAVAATRSQRYTRELYVAVENCVFVGCTALQAGALYFQNTSFTVDTSVFIANAAEQAGGGIYAAIKPWHSGLIRNSRFIKNSAADGGAVKWSNAPVLLANVTFQENSAAYGPDIASYGVALSPSLTHLAGNESSGYPLTVVFELLDHYGHRVKLSPFKNLVLLTTPTVSYRGNNVTLLSLGFFNFSGLTVYAPPASTQILHAVLNDKQEDFTLNIVGEITIKFRTCESGEIQRSDRCDYCYPGYFSFSPSDANCSFCPAKAFCPGGNALEVSSGYWRSAWNSSVVLLCPFPAQCLGGQNSTCLPSFTGTLCSECAANATHIRAVECVACRVGLVAVQLSAPVLVVLTLRWIVVRLAVYHASPNKLFVVKVLIGHLQYLSALCFLRVSYSGAITWSLHAVNWLSTLLVLDLPLACVGVSESEYAKALIGSLLLPTLLLLNFILYFLRPAQLHISSNYVLSSSLLFYTPYIALYTTIPLLACREMDSPQQVLFLDASVVCWEGAHSKYVRALVLPSVILNLVAPLSTVLSFRLFRPTAYYRHFPLWTTGYKIKMYDVFLSVVQWVFVGTLILSTALVPLLQVTYAFIPLIFLCTINVSLHRWIYTSERHFLLAEASLLTIALSLGFLSYYVFYLPGQGDSEYFANAIVFLLNAAFLCMCGCSLAFNWLEARKSDTSSSYHVPPNTPIESAEVSKVQLNSS